MPTRLDLAYRQAVQQVRDRVSGFARGRFGAGQYRDADLERFVAKVVPVVLAGQRQVSALTDAYLSRLLGIPTVGPLADYPRGVAPDEVYARPYVTVRTKLSQGLDIAAAVSAGVARLDDITATDMQLASTHTARATMQRGGVKRFARVLRGPRSCALCSVAATQRYSTRDLMPIHPGCHCGVKPIVDDQDFDEQSAANLEATHEAVAERFGQSDRGGRVVDYRKVLIVKEHGEMGPLLTVKGQHFTGPSAI